MSGICGIVRFDGNPPERDMLAQLTQLISFRGPDAQAVWCDHYAGLGHTLLRTTTESLDEHQPRCIDGRVWITADARIDGQNELRRKLEACGRTGLAMASDCELILHAYMAWGEDCVLHLIGDFAFAIWDAPRRRLFCARDHFGVKPFFYAPGRREFIFSNTLDCVRAHPSVSSKLDDTAIADYLLFEMYQDWAATAFADVRRLPPAHRLTLSAAGLSVSSYWTLPVNLSVSYRSAGDYVEHFNALLDQSVSDRMRTDRVAIEMSGGLDSTSVAAAAKRVCPQQSRPFGLHAFSIVYDGLFPDRERQYAQLAADHLDIPISYLVADAYDLYGFHRKGEAGLPEPIHSPLIQTYVDATRRMASFSRVALTGWDGDALLNESPKPYFRMLAKQGRYLRLALGMVGYGMLQRRLIPLTLRARFTRNRSGSIQPPSPPLPAWINRDLVVQLDLESRWATYHARQERQHALRPYAYKTFEFIRSLSNFFDQYDPGLTHELVEYRHPLLDLRVLNYCLSLPPTPWCIKKQILRIAMQGQLPEAVRLRPKTALAGNPCLAVLRRGNSQWVNSFSPSPVLSRFVDSAMIPELSPDTTVDSAWSNLRPLSLEFWLRSLVRR